MTDQNDKEVRKPRILIADDSKVIRVSAEKILGEDFDVMLAEDGQEAWEKIQADDSILVVFTDLGMPALDGYALLERVRTSGDERIRHMPVIVVTGNEGDEARDKALQRGATDFISKPFNKVDLIARARSHVEASRRARELKQQTQELEQYTTIDPLTRLGNRQFFLERLKQDRAFTLRHGQALSLLRIDIDDPQAFAGKAGKDAVLPRIKELGAIIRTCIRIEDGAARIGPSQFGVVLPTCDAEGARRLAARILKTLEAAGERHRRANGTALTVSIGVITPSDYPDIDLDELLTRLDEAVVEAHKRGGNRVLEWTPDIAEAKTVPGIVQKGPLATVTSPGEAPGIDEALRLIAAGESGKVLPHLPVLLQKVLPLLRIAHRRQKQTLMSWLLDHLEEGGSSGSR
ncbi:MAG TPA: diguanylate cyclase [Gammaproteobacteria bacterium]|nr:diguanylate cyclase [Gammaproteobacteria bacterium]